jgi:cell division protease FtsH
LEERATSEQAREFAAAFRSFLEWLHSDVAPRGHPVVDLIAGHLDQGLDESVVVTSLPPFEHVNLQVALNAWLAEPGRSHAVHGLALPPHYGGVGLHQLIHGDVPPLRLSAPDLVDRPIGA